MKEELTNKLLQWANNIENVISEELPSFILEIARYGFYSNLTSSIAFIILTFVCIRMSVIFLKKYENGEPYNAFDMASILFIILTIGFIIASLCSLSACIKAKVSPRLYVIERLLK